MSSQHEITRLLNDLGNGDDSAFEQLVPLVYDDLRRIARHHMRGQGSHLTLDTTGLVHEAYMRLVDRARIDWKGRDHFLAVYSVVMRNILVDMARRRRTAKRGAGQRKVTLDENTIRIDEQADQLLAIDQALGRLAALDERLAKVVECRFFGGLTDSETAGALGVNERTVQRDWVKARALLQQWMTGD